MVDHRFMWVGLIAAAVLVAGCDGDDGLTPAEAPVVESLEPEVGPTAGGTTITITGRGFGSRSAVTFGESPSELTSARESQLLAVLPEGEGSVDVQVESDGLTSSPRTFTYEAPTIDGISPATALTTGGTALTITGRNFGRSGEVDVGGGPVEVGAWSHQSAVFTSPTSDPGRVGVILTAGGQASNEVILTYECPENHEERDGECVPVGGE